MSRSEKLYECSNCNRRAPRSVLPEVKDPDGERFEPGDVWTDRECDECGDLAFPEGNANREDLLKMGQLKLLAASYRHEASKLPTPQIDPGPWLKKILYIVNKRPDVNDGT